MYDVIDMFSVMVLYFEDKNRFYIISFTHTFTVFLHVAQSCGWGSYLWFLIVLSFFFMLYSKSFLLVTLPLLNWSIDLDSKISVKVKNGYQNF